MQELLMQMLEKAKTDKKAFFMLKNLAVRCQEFELAVKVREMEKELFPESDEVKKAKEYAKELNTLFRTVELNISDHICFLIGETIKCHMEKGGEFSIMDATRILAKNKEIFDNSEE